MKNAIGLLLASRKNLIAMGAVLMCGVVAAVGAWKHLEKEYVVGLIGAITATAWKLMGAIAEEDSAGKMADAHVEAAKAALPATSPSANINVAVSGGGDPNESRTQ